MSRKISVIWIIVLSFAFGVLGSLGSSWFLKNDLTIEKPKSFEDKNESGRNLISNVKSSSSAILENSSFIQASKISTPAVVYIKTVSETQVQTSPFEWFFNPYSSRSQITTGTGSGVIISQDGYIVTNNHVVNGAQQIAVILNQRKREYKAQLIGVDPSTDLALLKIDADNLPFLKFGNSDDVSIGEWVIAVGNPFNLTSTVTAGIVSAKGRNINIVNNKFPIESFIQTDAAINPGNSGGALVSLTGELMGINTAIASKTGSYSGYGFAIPSNIANKIVKDFIEFGKVKRGFTGLSVKDIDYALQKEKSISLDNGVYVASIVEDSPVEKAGFKIGDVIAAINNKQTESKATYDEVLSYYRPGDEISFTIIRDGKEKVLKCKLISEESNTKLLRKNTITSEELGADFTPLTKSEKEKYGLESGIKVSGLRRGYAARLNLTNGFIITKYNGKSYQDAEKLIEDMKKQSRRIDIEGYGPNGGLRRMSFTGM